MFVAPFLLLLKGFGVGAQLHHIVSFSFDLECLCSELVMTVFIGKHMKF